MHLFRIIVKLHAICSIGAARSSQFASRMRVECILLCLQWPMQYFIYRQNNIYMDINSFPSRIRNVFIVVSRIHFFPLTFFILLETFCIINNNISCYCKWIININNIIKFISGISNCRFFSHTKKIAYEYSRYVNTLLLWMYSGHGNVA